MLFCNIILEYHKNELEKDFPLKFISTSLSNFLSISLFLSPPSSLSLSFSLSVPVFLHLIIPLTTLTPNSIASFSLINARFQPTCGPSDRCMTVTSTQSTYHCECPSDKRCRFDETLDVFYTEQAVYCSSR